MRSNAFQQIELNVEDKDTKRFLWLKDGTTTANDAYNLTVYRFYRVLFGAAPSPYLLNAILFNMHHFQKKTVGCLKTGIDLFTWTM